MRAVPRTVVSLSLALYLTAACGDINVAGGGNGADGRGNEGADTGGAPGSPVTCAQYCEAVTASCGTEGETAQYDSQTACRLYCESWSGMPLGTSADTDANTVGCRLYHATVAAQVDTEQHCIHAGPTGGGHCGPLCDTYCQLALRNCTGERQLFADGAECRATCDRLRADGLSGDREGDTVQCRIRALGLAGAEPPATAELHCPSAALGGGEVCVDRPTCSQYCEVVTTVCGDDAGLPQYPDREACLAYCSRDAGLPAGSLDDTSGNTIGCRIYHATVASQTTPEDHCVHAGPTGDHVCGTLCENYCHLAQRNCTGTNRLFGDVDDCLGQCAPVPADGQPGDRQGNTIQCRIFYVGLAGQNPPDSADANCGRGAITSEACF